MGRIRGQRQVWEKAADLWLVEGTIGKEVFDRVGTVMYQGVYLEVMLASYLVLGK